MKKLIIALLAATAAMGSAQAEAPRPYAGVAVASADREFNASGATGVSTEGRKSSAKIFGGVDIDQTFGVEVGYTDFGKNHADYTLNGAQGRAQTQSKSYYVAGKVTRPINEQVSVYGKLGASSNKTTLNSNTTAAYNSSERKTQVYAGAGVQYNLNQKVALVAEYERYGKTKDFGANANVISVGAKYAF